MSERGVARVEERPTSPEYPYQRDDAVLIHFTDGTALVISGSSYEEVSLSVEEIDAAEAGRWARAAQGRREAERLRRLQREEHLAVGCDERTRRWRQRRERVGVFGAAIEDMTESMYTDMVRDAQRFSFGSSPEPRTVRKPCPKCHERVCENAPIEVIQPVELSKIRFSPEYRVP